MGYSKKTLSDGTHMVYQDGDNMHKNHVHVAPDGTVLSWKVDNKHIFNRSEFRSKVKNLTGIDMDTRWSP